jgi:ASC-1-like (ASCH) protein
MAIHFKIRKVIHFMNLDRLYYDQIYSNQKKVEGRILKSERYKRIKKGDYIRFSKRESDDTFEREIIFTKRYNSFRDLMEDQGVENVLPSAKTIDEGVETYRQWYSEEKEKKYGVLGIGFWITKFRFNINGTIKCGSKT